jgi:hypothetical protein
LKNKSIKIIKKMKKIESVNYIKDGILFNFQSATKNSKTGDSVQIFMLPLEWIIEGKVMQDDSKICFDCVHSQGKEKSCYVRKGLSNLGIGSKVRSLHKKLDSIGEYSKVIESQILEICEDKIIRFGAYGEPVLLGEDLVYLVTTVAKGWMGYTHQWMKPNFKWAAKYFMASTETVLFNNLAQKLGFRTFFVTAKPEKVPGSVVCPASKEGGKKVNCNTCLLCSGVKGKGSKNINIAKH